MKNRGQSKDTSFEEFLTKILKGKAKGSKLLVLGTLMVSSGVTFMVFYPASWGSVFVVLGIIAFMRGLELYERETKYELEKKEKKTYKNKSRANFYVDFKVIA